jgi:hypothetical protein
VSVWFGTKRFMRRPPVAPAALAAAGDTQAGQQNGQGLNAFGALWYVVGPAGNQVI